MPPGPSRRAHRDWGDNPHWPQSRSRPRRPRRRPLRIDSLEDRTVPSLTLTLADPAILEGASTTATLTRSGDLSQPVTVRVDSSDPTEVTIPGPVTIAAGESSATFTVGAIDDTDADGAQSVNLLAWVDGEPGTAYATVQVYDNDATPLVQPDSYDAGEDRTLTVYGFGVLGNDYSPNGGLTASVVSGPTHGTLALDPGGSFTYTPAPNYYGTDSFVYRATDAAGLGGTATVTLTVWGMDDPVQLAAPGPQTTAEDTPLTFSAAAGNAFTITDIESPRVEVALLATPGVLTLRSTDGLEFPYPGPTNNNNWITFIANSPAAATAALEGLVFTPEANFNGVNSLSVQVRDLTPEYASFPPQMYVSVPITVTPVNDPPVAVDDAYMGSEDSPINADGRGVLGNDTDVEWDPLHAVLVSGPSHGTVTLNPNGTFTYTPNPNYSGTDTFTYRAADATSQSANVATVTLTIYPVDDPIQVTAPGPQTTAEDTPLVFSAAAGNAITVTDVENPPVLVSLLVQNGTLSLSNTAGLEFPDPASPNNSPAVTFSADNPAEANAALDGLVFTPNADFNGSTYLSVSVRDLTITFPPLTAIASVAITVRPVNDAPVAVNDGPYTVEAGETISTIAPAGPSYGVLANDTDVDRDPLSAVLVSGPSHGTLTFLGNGDWSYTPDAAYSGADTFTYKASDGQLESNVATVTFTVTPRNQEPVGAADAYAASEDATLTFAAPGVLANDTDPEGQPLTAQVWSGPAHGTLTLTADGSFTYRPSLDYNGPDEFWYRAFDGQRYSAPTRVGVTVSPVNDAPVAADDAYTVDEDSKVSVPVAAGVLANDTDVDGDALSAYVVTGPAHGSLTLNADGSFLYRPFANYAGTDSFTYRATDPAGASGLATVTLTVSPVNDAPVNLVPGPQTLVEDTTLTFSAAAGNRIRLTDLDAGASVVELQLSVNGFLTFPTTAGLTFVTGSNGGNVITVRGTLADLNAALDGLVFRPGANFNGTYSLQVTTNDLGNTGSGGAKSDTDFVTLNITPVNDAPQNVVPLITPVTAEDTPLTFNPPIWVTDPDQTTGAANAPVRVVLDFAAGGGTLTVGQGSGVTVTGNGTGQLVLVGTITDVNAVLRTLTFTPLANANDQTGPVKIRMTTDDQANGGPGALTDTDTFAVSVTPVNDAPVATGESYALAEDTTLTVPAPGVLANDTDVEGDALSAYVMTGPAHGTVTLSPTGSFTYTPAPDYSGTDSFTYRATDASSKSNEATVTLTINPAEDAIRLTVPGPQATVEDTALTFSAAAGNAITVVDPDSPRVYVELGTYGTLTLRDTSGLEFPYPEYTNNSGTIAFYADSPAEATAALEGLTLTPARDWADSVTLTVYVRDETFMPQLVYDFKDIKVAVSPVNDAPVAFGDGPYTIEAGEPLVTTTGGGGMGLGVLVNDGDVDGDPLSAVLVSGPSHGTLSFNPDGSFTYVADRAYSGADTFTYQASDGQLQSNEATVTITVTPRNLPPVSAADAYAVDEDGGIVIGAPGVLGNDADPEGQPLTAQLVTGPAHGTLAFNADGGFKYAPDANYNGADEFWYRAFDGAKYGPATRVGLTVSPVNDAPVALTDAYSLDEDTTLTVPAAGVLANDTDRDGDPLSASLVTGPAHGTVTVNADGSFTYTPAANYSGADSFTYRATDPAGASSTATVSLTVRAVNDAPVALDDAYSGTEDAAISQVVPGTTSVTMTSDTGDYIGQGQTYNLTPSNGTFTISRNYDNGVSVRWTSTSGSQWWSWDFAAPDEGLLMPGTYSNAMRFPFQTAGRPGMDVSGNGRGSNTLTGWFRIDEIAYGPTGEVLVFAATFEQHSEGRTPALRGTVRYNAGGTAPGGVVLNDSDADGNPLTATVVQGPQHGQLVFRPNGTFMYVPDANFAGVDTFQYRVSDGTLTSNVATVTLTVNAVNDGPANTVPGTQTILEDTPLTFSTATGNAIRVADADAAGSPIEVRLSASGSLTLATTAGLTFVSGSNGGNLFTVRGTVADLNAALDGLVFRPAADTNGSRYVQIVTNDLGNTGSGGALSDSDLAMVTITPVNDAPQNVVPPVTPVTAEDTALTFNPVISVTDPDQANGAATAPVKVTLEFASGGGALTVTPASGATVTGNGTGQVVLVGMIQSINNTLRTLVFTPLANANDQTAPVQIRMTTDDQANGGPGALTDVDVFAVSVTPVNDAPTTTGLAPVSVAEDAAPTAVDLTGSFGDIEDGGSGLTYTVVGNTNPGLFGSVGVANGVLTLNYAANAYGSATLTVRATDAGGLWVEAPLTVTVSPVNDAPTSSGLAPVSVAEDAGPTAVTLTDYFADAEDGPAGLTFSVTGNTNPALFTSVTVANGVLTLAYAPNANGTATLTVRATDGAGLWVEAPLAVTVTPVNDAPTGGGLPAVSVAEDAPATAVDLTGYFGDTEDGSAGLTYSVVGNTNPGLFGSVSAANGVLTLNSGSNLNGSATITVRATDSGGLWVEAPLSVTVRPVNDAPTFTAGPNVTVASDAGPQSFAGWASAISAGPADEAGQALTFDVSTDSPLLFAVQPSIDPATGALKFTPVAGASGTATVTVLLRDSGGTADGGADASTPVTFTITLTPAAGAPGVQVVGTTLVVTGGTGADSVTIAVANGGNGSAGLKVTGTVNGQAVNKTFKQTFTGIRVYTAGGNDTVSIADAVGLPTTVDGGAGDDSLKGGGGNDLILGGTGNDTINGAAGDDDIDAGAGNDSVTGGLGRDLAFGQAGDDTLQGGDGNDFLIGGLGADQLFGQNGDDLLVAGSVAVRSPSSDSLRQVLTDWGPTVPGVYAALRSRLAVTDDPASADRLQGDAQTDWFWSADPTDVLDLGAGEQRN